LYAPAKVKGKNLLLPCNIHLHLTLVSIRNSWQTMLWLSKSYSKPEGNQTALLHNVK
jgi:hypothetical protein